MRRKRKKVRQTDEDLQRLADEYAEAMTSRSAFGLRVGIGVEKYEPETPPSLRKKEK